MKIERVFTVPDQNPLDQFEWREFDASIRHTDGRVLFSAKIEAPITWSQTAAEILASKYARRAGVPQPDGSLGGETSGKQIFTRLARFWRHIGEENGYFDGTEDAQAFEDEVIYGLAAQIWAPNSPQWFNSGLAMAYSITGHAQGHFYTDPETGETRVADDAYTHPQTSACFIQSLRDDLVGDGGIFDLVTREARLFKYGSGTGTNFSVLRAAGEPLSGGGTSSGLMSWLKINDRAAGAVKSGGTTRRAAKIVILDADHPDIETFIAWKVKEEKKVAAMIAAGYSSDFNGEAYETVSGQNANNSVHLSHGFMRAMLADADWHLTWRTTGEVKKTLKARGLWEQIAKAAWAVADPGVQYDSMNDWNPAPHVGDIHATNPCSEFVFLDDTACNLASINLGKFLGDNETFDTYRFRQVVRIITLVLEITVTGSGFPTEAVARNSYRLRPLGLGFANLGAMLMRMGLPYDSNRGRAVAAAVTAIMTGEAYTTSAMIAKDLGPYADYNAENHLRVLKNHVLAAHGRSDGYVGLDGGDLPVKPVALDAEVTPAYLRQEAEDAWTTAYAAAQTYGLRNAQVTLLAPTGTIGILMDCDTTGVEPDYALVKNKKLAGGGYLKMVNQSVEPALRSLGYTEDEIAPIMAYVLGTGTIRGTVYEESLDEDAIAAVDAVVPKSFSLAQAFELAGVATPDVSAPLATVADEQVFGYGTLEGAPIRPEHLAVFDCAVPSGTGTRSIAPMGHVRTLAVLQPFLSGGISKTVNMPNETTWEEVANAYLQAYQLGVKAVAIYRDSSKLSQPLTSGSPAKSKSAATAPVVPAPATDGFGLARGQKRKLPSIRSGQTYELTVGGQKMFLRTGEYEDGTLGEFFVDLAKEGATLRSLMNQWAILASKAIQYGLPLDDLVDSFLFVKFEPGGIVQGHPNIKMAQSLIDAIGRVLAFDYLGREDIAQVPGTPRGPATPRISATSVDQMPVGQTGAASRSGSAAEVAASHTSDSAGDQVICNNCGHLMRRNGACHVCPSCGATDGCS